MKKILAFFTCCMLYTLCFAQLDADQNFVIINDEKVITNEMVFLPPTAFKKNKAPLFLVNGKPVNTIAYYNRDELKRITVLSPAEGMLQFGKKARNGVVVVDLKDKVKGPEIEVVTNKIYYKCEINGKLIDTSKQYYDRLAGKDCYILDLRDTSKLPLLYSNFRNEIKIKNLGVGWDMTSIYVVGATLSRNGNNVLLFAKKEGAVKMNISTCATINNCTQKEIIFSVIPLPSIKK